MLNAISNNLNSYNANLDNKNIRNLNLDTTLPLNTTSSQNLVKPKSEAVSEILGYGVDSEGFFTADFNEAAGIPKDFKINAELIKGIDESLRSDKLTLKPLYYEIDWALELGTLYKNKLQNFDEFGKKFDKKELKSEFNISFKDINTKADTLLLLLDMKNLSQSKNTLYGKTYGFGGENTSEFDSFMQKNQLKSPNENSSFAFMLNDAYMGVDAERSKLQGFADYTSSYNLGADLVKEANAFIKEFDELLSQDLSLDEFKEKYLDFKNRHDIFVKKFQEAMGDKLLVKDIEKPFTPIQAESKNETYTYDDIAKNFFLSFLENERKKGNDVLELLQSLFRADKDRIDMNV